MKEFLINALQTDNVRAFLMMIRHSEGTAADDGYNYIFGSSPENKTRFNDFSKHPDIHVQYGNTFSTAAGAYQILFHTWETIAGKYSLPDFSPENQDIAAAELISERNVLQKLMDGNFNEALTACSSIWASLPGNSYGQPEHSIDQCLQWYTGNGGTSID